MFDHFKLPKPPVDRSFKGWFEWQVRLLLTTDSHSIKGCYWRRRRHLCCKPTSTPSCPSNPHHAMPASPALQFRINERGSSVLRETRAGIVLFLVSVFSVLLNPVILSGAASGYNTGMPPTDVALATA